MGREAPSDLGDLVELAKELIEHQHQLLWGALTGQPREAHDVSIQHAGQGRLQSVGPWSRPMPPPLQSSLPIPDSLVPLDVEAVEVVGVLWPRPLSSLQPCHDLCLHLSGQVGRKDGQEKVFLREVTMRTNPSAP